MTELLAAVIGALVAGGSQLFDSIIERRRRRESTLVAIAAEVTAVISLIRHQGYFEEFKRLSDAIRTGTWNGTKIIIDIRSNYFSTFDAVSSDIGLLKPLHVAKIVAFYSYCKSAIDSTRPDGPFSQGGQPDEIAGNILAVEGTLGALLLLGEEIATFPRRPLPEILSA